MKLTLVFCLLVIATSSFGQKIRFTDVSNVWTVKTYYPGGLGQPDMTGTSSLYYTTDTIINGKVYRRLNTGDLFREDTVANIVYYLIDTSEQILYNYNWKAGDTIIANYGIRYHIYNVYSVTINGLVYKVWYCLDIDYTYGDYINIIEGIGCTNDMLYRVYPGGGPVIQLVCFKNSSGTPILNHAVTELDERGGIANFDNANSCTVSVDNLAKSNKSISVSPNPVDATSKITFPKNIQNGKLTIYNFAGQIIININFKDKEEFLIGNLTYAPGIYCYRVTDNENGTSFSGKFVCR